MRIVVAMSGGVDSSVAAALLAESGADVVGVSMQLYDQREGAAGHGFGGCCSLDDLADARRVAARIGIAHYVMNFERQFEEMVVADFVSEYASGRTPLPCAHCNSDLKFSTLLERARGLGADHLATGHYAQVDYDEVNGRYRLLRGRDRDKDQSYFLFALTQEQLSRARFPVGALAKSSVREHARRFGLQVAEKADSQELCFVPDGAYAGFLERHGHAAASGPIVDVDGRAVGTHAGVHRFTVGQRKGLGLSATEPLYVVAIDAGERAVVVGPASALERRTCHVERVNWIAGEPPASARRLHVQIRSRHVAAPATVEPLDPHRALVTFELPQRAITPGQAAVFYDGDEVIGGGWIRRSAECGIRNAPAACGRTGTS
jgi:tRNA-specific 2-thiouridylase